MKKNIIIAILCIMILFIPQAVYNFSAETINTADLEIIDFLTRVSLQTFAVLLVMVLLIIILLFKDVSDALQNVLLMLLGIIGIGIIILLNLYVVL